MKLSEKTLYSHQKQISVIDDVALLNLLGRDFLGKVGIDFRIFRALTEKNISVSFVVQGMLEKGIGLVVAEKNADAAVVALKTEFAAELAANEVLDVVARKDIAIVSVTGENWSTFPKALNALIKNSITPILINNTISGENVNLVLSKYAAPLAAKVIYSEVFGTAKTINLAVFGHGTVGGTLINQILASAESIEKKKKIRLNIFAIANSKKIIFNEKGIGKNWREEIRENSVSYMLADVFTFARRHHLENLIAVDNTASKAFTNNYIPLISNGFDLVSSNKIANTLSYDFFRDIRAALEKHKKHYLYETNVGAGLPLIDTIGLLHLSGENITRIRGVFSGTLSYIFNNFSGKSTPFSQILEEAMNLGLTEPDPREDLSGNDVARKLLILARELDLENEMSEVAVQNLVPAALQKLPVKDFLQQLTTLDAEFDKAKNSLPEDHVLRYVGELSGDLQQPKGILEVKLIAVPKNTALGSLRGADSLFEIYTESYGTQPIVIQGAGAGGDVTARGVFGDILRLTQH